MASDGKTQDQTQSNQIMQQSLAQSQAAFDATNKFVGQLQADKPENTQAATMLRNMGMNFLKGYQTGDDKGKYIQGQLGFINSMAANNRRASQMGRGVGGRMLTGGADPNLQSQLDYMGQREDQQNIAQAGEEIYDNALTNAENQAMQGENSVNEYDTRSLGALSGVAGLANQNENFAFQYKQWANRPGQGIFSRFIAPFAQTAMAGLLPGAGAALFGTGH
jgi:hypothetical protein